MRYYSFSLGVNVDYLLDNAREKIKHYSFQEPIDGLNNYMYRNLENSISFLAYREEDNSILASFTYDEKRYRYDEVYEYLVGTLALVFKVNQLREQPYEITMFEFHDNLMEAKRREYINFPNRLADATKLWMYYSEGLDYQYDFEEKIIAEDARHDHLIYDRGFIDELNNIDNHMENDALMHGNVVHYVISGRSIEAASEMTETLMKELYRCGRINSRRMEIISDMDPELYRKHNHIEEIIENNNGGVVVFDMSERFGHKATEYTMLSKQIEKLVKKYRNDCLFVFTYNMDNPGFSYSLLPRLKNLVIPVMLREGSGDRRAAVEYLKSLIQKSEYSEYSEKASEFMKQFSGDTFTQTDVLNAFEQFGSWCLNITLKNAYSFDTSEGFVLDRDENEMSSYERLQKLIGLDLVKKQIDSIISSDIMEKERKKRRGHDYQTGTMHMVFAGNPGSAKTTVAKLFAGVAKEKGILKSGAFVMKGGMDLDGMTCVVSIREAFLAAKGGVLFIDEAYSMKSDTAVTALIQEMENHREDVIVILAGYNERMKEFLKINEGLKSRVPHWIDFPDYTADELTDIFKLMLRERGFRATKDAVKEANYIFEKARNTDNFGNGRYVRNLIDRAIQNQSVRLTDSGKDTSEIKKSELFRIEKMDICMPGEGQREEREPGTAEKELGEMIGLSSVKDVIRKATANYKLRKLCVEKGIPKDRVSMHMVFTGNPGTAKTTVARLFAEIMKDEKILPTGCFVEVGRADLVGCVVGSTAKLVKEKFKEAQGGVLFIDEAYALLDGYSNGYGDEAINTLVQEMENHREDVIVVFAGYPEPMKAFLNRNPGMLSRIAFQVEFDDYSVGELREITRLMLEKKQMTITDDAMEKLQSIYEQVHEKEDYGNGRFVRRMLEEAEMNLAERVLKLPKSQITAELITTIEESDIPELPDEHSNNCRRFGFVTNGG